MDQRKNTENGFNENGFNTVEEALEDLRQGKLILVTDDPDRENEGDFICAAEFATTENINFMAVHGKGLICMPMSEAYVEKLQLPQMVTKNTDNHETAFTVSIDCVDTTTGISAAERSITAMRCVAEDAKPEDFRRPGHMFPLLAKKNGVLERNGHTEATVDLCRLAGLKECGLCCEIMKEDGTMMRTPQLKELAKEWNIKFITIKDLQEYRKVHEQLVERVTITKMPTKYGVFKAYGYINRLNGEHHVALVKGDIGNGEDVLCRVHSECLTGDVFGSLRCDCGQQFAARSEEHTSELQSLAYLVCRLLLEKKAKVLAKSVITSSLTKAAIFGHDANWGRILCAMGYSGAQFDPEKVDLFFESAAGHMQIIKDGVAVDYSEEEATKILSEPEVTAIADIKMGDAQATAWGCDLTFDYVKINADYRS